MSVGRLPTASHPPGGPQSLLAGGRASEAFRRPPTGQEGHLPPREVSLPPGGQNPITLEYQIYPPTIDSLVTGMDYEEMATITGAPPQHRFISPLFDRPMIFLYLENKFLVGRLVKCYLDSCIAYSCRTAP